MIKELGQMQYVRRSYWAKFFVRNKEGITSNAVPDVLQLRAHLVIIVAYFV